MPAFDTAITPVASSPTNTSNAVLFTASGDTSVLITAANLTALPVAVRIGITPSGGSIFYVVYDLAIPANDAVEPYGPFFLQTGDTVDVRTATANAVTFALTGVESS